MKDTILVLEEYKRDIKNKNDLDNGNISLEELSLEELDGVSNLYMKEITTINREIEKANRELDMINKEIEQRTKNIERLKQENSYLKKHIKKFLTDYGLS